MDHRPEWIDRFRSDTLPRAHTDEDYWKGSTVRIRISFMQKLVLFIVSMTLTHHDEL